MKIHVIFSGNVQRILVAGVAEHGSAAGVPRPRANEECESRPGRAHGAAHPQQTRPGQRDQQPLEKGQTAGHQRRHPRVQSG